MKSTGKESLISFLMSTSTEERMNYTWLELANRFEIKTNGTDSQKRKAANDIWRNFKKTQGHSAPTIEEFNSTNYYQVEKDYSLPGCTFTTSQYSIEKFIESQTEIKSNGVYIIMGCVHVPFFNLNFMKAAVKCISNLNVKGIIFNGDFLDLATLSFHDKGKNTVQGVNLGDEYKSGNLVLDTLEAVIPRDAEKIFLYGNHEDRFNRHMATVDYAKLKGALKSPIEGLNLESRGYKIYTDWINDEVNIGDLTIIHGEFVGTNSCKRHLDAYKKNILFCHTHRASMHREGEHVAYNIGSMADFNSPAFGYATKSMKKQWTNGFAIATVVDGVTSVEQIIWNKDHFVYGGNIWKV